MEHLKDLKACLESDDELLIQDKIHLLHTPPTEVFTLQQNKYIVFKANFVVNIILNINIF